MKKYDYIFIGAGCAALSLLTRMIAANLTKDKRILLIDKSTKNINDRTWCFWEKDTGFFESVVCRQWDTLWFHTDSFSKKMNVAPYRYKMIQGIDFYDHCFKIIHANPGIEIINGTVSAISSAGNVVQLNIDGQEHRFTGDVVFNSLWNEAAIKQQSNIYLLQHFKGWMIETTAPFFNPGEATLMDFRVSQSNGTTFAYVLPLTATKALVEYTIFSEKILADNAYDEGLANYLHNCLQLSYYTITAQEFGAIPMTDAKFEWYANGMYHIGTSGGQTKASSGYTFQFIQKQSAAIIGQMQDNTFGQQSKPAAAARRFAFYDAILLRVLADKPGAGSLVFADLFERNSPRSIFSFLDNESSVFADLRIIQSLPALPFLKAAGKHLFKA